MQIYCMSCGIPVSTEVPDSTVIRAWIECAQCLDDKAISVCRNSEAESVVQTESIVAPAEQSSTCIHNVALDTSCSACECDAEDIAAMPPCVKCGGRPDDWRHIESGDLDVGHAYTPPSQ